MAENVNTPAEEEVELPIIELADEEGQEHAFDVLDELDHNGAHYMALVPHCETEEDLVNEELELLLMKVGEDAEGAFYDVVDDDDELGEIYPIFRKRLMEMYDFEE